MESVIVFGSGFLGGHILRQLSQRKGLRIAAFDVRANEELQKELEGKFEMFTGDITNKEDVEKALKTFKPQVVIHTVSPVHNLGRDIYFHVNVDGTENLLRVARENGVAAFVYTSSAGVVFDGHDLINVNEECPLPEKPMDAYNESKAMAEKAVIEANCPEMKTVGLRVAGLFGPGDRQMVPGMMNVLKNNQTKFQLGDNLNLFDFTYIENAAYSHLLAADKLLAGAKGVDGQVYFITNGQVIYFWDFPRALWAHVGHVPPYIIKMPRAIGLVLAGLAEWACAILGKEPGFTRFRVKFSCANRYYDISKARTLLGYEPKVDLEEGIRRTLKWVDETKQ
ncbi:3 beta-hydroxysteroid dehydrogenase/delta 5-4- isomerase [Schizosaccharomyces japonicus yFS275]|uniref:3 beta-hydroxysteroid dehydrogenase/delta 5-4-isomerase n=1 Tax=Schizosaccharomyces japonicus (strain yFS275 / FY16936) TaxID=402676 RepID=B6K1D0_SCHJY|nr:3 beta-hydroxysteroid dehydrogenase/delta 5-4- isomerase [Schizosaccharomyces japonicus yFS275]EEB07751.1 3 beta-hydroxysteroid dehydrogenase/delta 5-4- isomerase [Schizosaccharomyces japonicus yFS275]